MKKVRHDSDIDDWILRGFIVACVIGVVAMVVAEHVVTGEDVLEAGVSWQSWIAAGVAALLTFSGFLAWGRRKSPPMK